MPVLHETVGRPNWTGIIQRIANTNPTFSQKPLPILFCQLIRYLIEYISYVERESEPTNSVISNILRVTFYILHQIWPWNPRVNFYIDRTDDEFVAEQLELNHIIELTKQFSIIGLRLNILWPEWDGFVRERDIGSLGYFFSDLLSVLSCRTEKSQFELTSALLEQELRLERLARYFSREN
jgi:hypothetical protein